ncbi:PKD domain-containing protein [Chryseobacterium gwangjuense]|uniref:PKD domain-containing protein n=1 Tax=Chryseobacterium gwangjuense TaxID=1069980 RepID=UPI001E5C82E3|nr:PKD domain-containing protein [Chryseobacterium gwangjuense]MCE3075652.1 PKD domain-containing protein [Chryseobacterium gwangjuense]
MKKTLLLLLLTSLSLVFGQSTKKVFFVGNSYTYYNDLPVLIASIAASTGDVLIHQSHTPGGSTLQDHANNQNVTSTISLGNWDYVVLQEQSQLPSFPLSQVQTDVFPFAQQLSTLVNNQNACGNVIFYMTWGRKSGDQSNCSSLPYNCTYQGMDDKLYERYMQMATDNESLVSPVGKVWRNIRTQYPSLELYSSDESHPSYLGSMAAAYTFYTIIFKKDPTLTTFNGNLTVSEANILKNTVKNVVFDHMNTWLIPTNDVHSQFSFTYPSSQTVQFTNQTQNATSFLWNFGDGTTSILENPQHHYATPGNYTVSLTTNACGGNSTKTKNLIVNNLSILENSKNTVQIYPNPTSNFINIVTDSKFSLVSLKDATGRIVNHNLKTTESGYIISLQHLSSGVYLLQYKIDEKEYTQKIIKK